MKSEMCISIPFEYEAELRGKKSALLNPDSLMRIHSLKSK